MQVLVCQLGKSKIHHQEINAKFSKKAFFNLLSFINYVLNEKAERPNIFSPLQSMFSTAPVNKDK